MTTMSTQRLRPRGSSRQTPRLVLAAALAFVLWSCDSEQTGYNVVIPLIGPIEFDETSCEVSGDICSTDDDCFDEDGFNVGPCTDTMTPLEPITVSVSLSPSNPSYTLATPDTAAWIAPFAVQQLSDESLPIRMTMESFSLQGGPVTVSVRIFSRIGLILGQDADYEPVTPSSCSFTLDTGSTGQDYADGINACLSDWIAENGAPVEFDMEVSSSSGAALATAALKSGFGLKQEQDYLVTGSWTMETENPCEKDYSNEVLEAVEEGNDFFGLLECSDLSFEGSGTTDQPITISGGAGIWDRCNNFLAVGGLLRSTLQQGTYTVTVYEEGMVVDVEQDVPVVFLPSAESFAESLLSAAAGNCRSGAPLADSGYAIAWWDHCAATDPPPDLRTGSIEFGAQGFCSVAGGSDQDSEE